MIVIVGFRTRELANACLLNGRVDDVSHYIREGVDVNQTDIYGRAPIHFACESLNAAVLAILLENGADPNLLTETGFRALGIACSVDAEIPLRYIDNVPIVRAKGNQEIVVGMLLAHGARPNAFDSNGMAPLHRACNSQNAAIVALLLEHGANVNLPAKKGVLPLHIASSKGEEIVHILLEHGADANAFDGDGMASLHHACDSQNAAIVAGLLEHGADVNLPTKKGVLPLHLASKGRVEIVQMLLKHGADVNVLDADGMAPIHIACKFKRWGSATVATMLASGADVNLPSKDGVCPLHIALEAGLEKSVIQICCSNMVPTSMQYGEQTVSLLFILLVVFPVETS